MMYSKRCLFCTKIVSVELIGNQESFVDCYCAPDSCYSLSGQAYESLTALSHADQSELFPLISGYIRDLIECGERVELSYDNLETIRNSARLPLIIADKENLLLRYLYKRCNGPHESIHIRPLSDHVNLTYSRTLQEFVYVIEQLREKKWIERVGTTFELTELGWEEAVIRIGKRHLEPCIVFLPNESLQQQWRDYILPILDKYGFYVRFLVISQLEVNTNLISDCKLFIADLTGDTTEGYFLSGLALGLGIQVICTMQHRFGQALLPVTNHLQPILGNDIEELSIALRNKLTKLLG